MEPHLLGADDGEEESAQDQPEGELRHVQQALQQHDCRGDHAAREDPGHHGEAGDLREENEHSAPSRPLRVVADRESHEQQREQLGDEGGGEYPDSNRFPEMPLVDEHFGREPEAGQREDAGERDGFGQVEAQTEVVDDVGSDGHRGEDRDENGQGRGDEVAPANRGHESGNVELVQADEKEQEKDPDPQENLDLAGRLNDLGNRSQQDPRRRVRDDRIHPESPQRPLDQLGDHYQQADRQEGVFDHDRFPALFAGVVFYRTVRKGSRRSLSLTRELNTGTPATASRMSPISAQLPQRRLSSW